tara:strand:+ start:621 stop:2432 length:1812 start_codon:yes stop_codon:yes gene_type:complete
MLATFLFIQHQYALLATFCITFFGLGWPFVGWMVRYPQVPTLYRWSLQVTTGAGLLMVMLFVAGVLGALIVEVVMGLVLLGWCLSITAGLYSMGQTRRACDDFIAFWRASSAGLRLGSVALLLVSIPLLTEPLQTPYEWDELMYHLPYARFWAEQGNLEVNEWLRYPLSAYNMNLLYVAALMVGSDVLPHLLHMFFGLLAALLTFVVGRSFLGWKIGLAAGLLVVYGNRWAYDNAFVDLGLMAFWAAAFACLAMLYQHRNARYAFLAAFLAGMAVGIKYQGLFYLPVFIVLALVLERRVKVVVGAVLVFVLAGGYWYLRNYLLSGDPVHPLGGPIFGFWLWDARDLANQIDDVDRAELWQHWVYLPALFTLLFWRRSSLFLRGMFICATAYLAIWYVGSGYWRYAVSVYPMLALLTAWVMGQFWSKVHSASLWGRLPRASLGRVAIPALIILALASSLELRKGLAGLHPSGESRAEYLSDKFAGYALVSSITQLPDVTLYQLGFENQIYYLSSRTIGDWFGPARYADVMALSRDAPALSRHLAELGADMFLVNLDPRHLPPLDWDPEMEKFFKLLGRSDKAVLYLRIDPLESALGSVSYSKIK